MSKWPEKILQESNYASNIIKEAYLKQCTEYFIWIEKINAVIDACRAAADEELWEFKKGLPGQEEIEKELKNIGAYWTITEQDVGKELFVIPSGKNAIKIKAASIKARMEGK